MSGTIRRLTFVTDAPHFGGAERYIITMAHAARRHGIEPHIYWTPLPISDADVFNAERVGDIPLTIAHSTAAGLGQITRQYRSMLKKIKPDALVINASGRPRFWAHALIAQCAKLPNAWVHHMVEGRDYRHFPPRWFGQRVEGLHLWRIPQALRHRLGSFAASVVIVSNRKDRDRINHRYGISRKSIHVIPPGIDGRLFYFDKSAREQFRARWSIDKIHDRQPFVVGTAGRLAPEKRFDLLIHAIAHLHEKDIPAVAIIAGEGAERNNLIHLTNEKGMADVVKFVHFKNDMREFYSALDVFVSCSETESFGLAIAEAMACERPVVSTPTAGAGHQIKHLVNGWQLRTFSPIELACALKRLYRDLDTCQMMGKVGRAGVIENFSIDLTLEKTLQALRGTKRKAAGFDRPAMGHAPFSNMIAEDVA